MKQLLKYLFGGFFMGAADLVPGVSGGTIALVLGLYERLIESIREGSSAIGSFVFGRPAESLRHLRTVEWRLLTPLLGGITLAIVSLSQVLESQLAANPTVMAGGFFGLVVGSVIIAWRLVGRPAWHHGVIATVVGLALFGLLGVGDDAPVDDPSLLVFGAAGALAICAMILPGISGSLILLLVGMYSPVLGAVNDRDLTVIAVFGLGAVVGLALFSQVLHWALARWGDLMLAGLIGLMSGSLRVLWPWPGGVESRALEAPGSDLGAVGVAALLGLVVVFAIARLVSAAEDDVIVPMRPV